MSSVAELYCPFSAHYKGLVTWDDPAIVTRLTVHAKWPTHQTYSPFLLEHSV